MKKLCFQELGMFMSCLSVVGVNGEDIEKSCKSSILEFKYDIVCVCCCKMIVVTGQDC